MRIRSRCPFYLRSGTLLPSTPMLDTEVIWLKLQSHTCNYPILSKFAKKAFCAKSAASEQLFSSSGKLISPLRNSHVILYTCMILPLLGVNELRCHFIRMFLFKIYFIGLPQAKNMGSCGWVVGPFCAAERGSYNVHVCYSIHQVCKYYKQNTLTQTTCNNIGYTFLQALLVVLFVEQTPTDGTVIILSVYLLTQDCLCYLP